MKSPVKAIALQYGLGAMLVVLSLLMVAHAIRCEVSEVHYYAARYGADATDPNAVEDRMQRVHRLYPWNYFACIWAGKTAYYSGREQGDISAVRLDRARYWAEEGLRVNPYNSELMHLEVELLSRLDPAAALALWKPYVDRRFWVPFNQFVLLDLAARAGDTEQADEALFWLQDTPLYEQGEAIVTAAWRKSLD